MIIQGQCQALLETEERDKPVFVWVLWQHQSPTSHELKFMFAGAALPYFPQWERPLLQYQSFPFTAILGHF